ncbi:MAG: type toxin-antitoxin system RelE/ParE family toxin [Caulobacter sp.]|nr:type toxin-antitoxin system RelE/ParE family toxin [Caulobacter sp.]
MAFDKNPDAGHRAVVAIVRAIRSLRQFPHRGYLAGLGMRHLHVAFGKRGYVIRYEVKEADVQIVRVFHGLEDR